MADKLVYISNDDTQNYPFCKLQLDLLYSFPSNEDLQNYPFCTLQLVVETFKHSTE